MLMCTCIVCVRVCVRVCVCVQASINKTLQWPSNTLVFTQQSTPQNTVGDRTINSKEGCTSHMMWEMHTLVHAFQVLLGPHCTTVAMWPRIAIVTGCHWALSQTKTQPLRCWCHNTWCTHTHTHTHSNVHISTRISTHIWKHQGTDYITVFEYSFGFWNEQCEYSFEDQKQLNSVNNDYLH